MAAKRNQKKIFIEAEGEISGVFGKNESVIISGVTGEIEAESRKQPAWRPSALAGGEAALQSWQLAKSAGWWRQWRRNARQCRSLILG